MSYSHIHVHAELYIYIYIYIYILDTYRRNDNRRKKTSLTNILTSHFIRKGTKGYSKFACERELETEHNLNILTSKLWSSALCLYRSQGLLNRSPGVCWVLIFLTTSRPTHLQLYSTVLNCLLLFNSSALYYLQTPTRWYGHASTPLQFLPISGDRDVSLPLSLEMPVWSSSSGNNCHAVQRSLFSGASVYESIMGFFFYLVPFHQPISAHAISSHNCH